MNSASKIAIAVVAVALILVIGLMVINFSSDTKNAALPTAEPTMEATQAPTEAATNAPEEEAQDEAQSNGEMYEGALAGLTEEEIGKLAMAEEQHESDGTGEEPAEEGGSMDESVAGVAD